MPNEGKEIFVIIGLIFIIFSFAFVFPAIQLQLNNDSTKVIETSVNETTVIKEPLQTKITNVDNNSVDLILIDSNTGNITVINTLNETESQTVFLSNNSITVTNENMNDDTVFLKYTYPVFFGWPDGAITIIDNLPLILMLSLILMIVGIIMVILGVFRNAN